MSSDSLYCKDETTVASQVASVSVTDPAPTQEFSAIPPKRGEQASARAGENASAVGGK